ncbi:hypothetical protein PHYBLDRAFT_162621 [Phycomyces blakesleeanus NRRL 1555(-)]|uniref:Histone deacetylase interacting domain-containing protein n=1 Tax=Phycomyces blakesleeanus (strain ATCC 8743b / DSM 1359 / FGSC 10004 / NBRC 33097 / NRRL 1555) TaxID=763407 RepID=A0A167QE27_PHYB8|nr:hypothetical protein PHYBLDRAFT_162621 [Phycomyces blakesleeanus NRRL 1555(-)]OAD79564.1 hypothetical protein PHYBLDRAFT_162621 [Phycomyces blakesleeanus NRRL 1555(-)]|eukprot:XP_018297604.1 hypothetical protein PHYBLDRAFT_162621 [Phycomyces blakesleeanus NRRL 1555(-)]
MKESGLRPPSASLPQTQPSTSASVAPPFPHHLSAATMTSKSTPSQQPSPLLALPSRVSDMSYQSPSISSSSPNYSTVSQPPHTQNIHGGMLNLSPSGSIASNAEGHTSKSKSHPPKPMLPPMLARNRAPSPFADHAKSAIPRVHSPPVGTPPKHSATTGYRPLNVRDALTYLDQVKVQFSDQPDVYNRFLDIMKDFKSQSIDTPGVIERVSTLFKGHPTLISGFNTFLPPGYRIECSYDPREPDLIRVTTPSGTTTTTGGSSSANFGGRMMESDNIPATQPYYPSYGHMPAPPPQQMSMHSNPQSSMQGSYPPIGESSRPIIPQYQSNVAGQTQQANGKRGPVEFNHAINYVNKIKNRFTGRPETYKQFLEILQTYQKEQKPIQVVYTHVQSLFDGAPDLLDEFKQFLPEITGQPASVLFGDIGSPYYVTAHGGPKHNMHDSSPHSTSMIPPGKKKRVTGGERSTMNVPPKTSKRSKIYHKQALDGESGQADPYAYPVSPFDPVSPTVTVEEVELFERIRKHIGNKPSYEEFLKTLNLYTQQIITLETLIEQISTFLGNNKELFDWFKSVVSYEPSEKEIEPPNPTIPKPDLMHCKTVEGSPSYRLVPKSWQNQPCSGRDQLAWEVLNDEYVSHPIWASEDDGFVASKKSQYEEAMHRCEEERYDYNLNIEANLNTIALLEPIAKKIETMNAEEKAAMRLKPGLGGQSVTIYERIIKKVYDKERGLEIIELLYTNPAHVVPILLKRLKQKDEEWKKAQREWNKIWRELDAKNFYKALDYQGINFKSNDRKAMAPKSLINEIEVKYHRQNLPQKSILGNSKSKSKSIYQYTYPCKDPEVFKDVTRIIFSYIDRQTGFTGNDREKIRTFIRTFIPLWFHVEDVVPEGMSHYIDDVDEEDIIDEDEDAHSTNTDDSESEFGRSPGKRSMSPSRQRHARGNRSQEDDATMDLLRDVLTKNKTAFEQLTGMEIDESAPKSPSAPEEPTQTEMKPIKEEEKDSSKDKFGSPAQVPGAESTSVAIEVPAVPVSESVSGTVSEPVSEEPAEAVVVSKETSPTESTSTLPKASPKGDNPESDTVTCNTQRTNYDFFCNNTFYCFFRLYETLYARLIKMKALDADMRANPRKGKRANKVAAGLGLYSNRFDELDLSNGYYHAILELIDKLFDGELEQPVFEESTRYLFCTEAYVFFTVDKLALAIIKQIQAITVDTKSVELIRLLRSDQSLEMSTPKILSVYRSRAEDIVGSDENLYRINFNTESKIMSIQLLGRGDSV